MRYSVPIFIMISGSVLMYAELQRGSMSYFAFQRKRLGKIVLPYILWTAFYVYFGARTVWREEGFVGFQRISHTLPSHFQNGDGWYHLYFLLIIVQLYLLYPILRGGLKRWPISVLSLTFALTVADQVSFYLGRGVWRYDFFPNWIFFFAFGMFFALNRVRLEGLLSAYKNWIGVSWILSLALLIADGRLTHSSYTSIKPTVVLYALTSFLFFYVMARSLSPRLGRYGRLVDWVSTQSFFVYLAHPFVLNLLDIIAKKVHNDSLWDGTTGMIAKYGLTVGITLVGTMVVARIPFTSLIGTVRSKRKGDRQLPQAQIPVSHVR